MTTRPSNTARVVDSAKSCPEIPIIVGRGNARVVMWPGNDTQFRTLQILTLEDGDRTIPLNHGSDAVYYVISGAGLISSRMAAKPETTIPVAAFALRPRKSRP